MRCLQHIGQSIKTTYIADFMGVCNYCGGSTGNHKIGEFLGSGMAGLNMYMTVYKTWQEIAPPTINHRFGFSLSTLSKTCNVSGLDQEVSLKPLLVIYIQNMGIRNAQVSFLPSCCSFYHFLQSFLRNHSSSFCNILQRLSISVPLHDNCSRENIGSRYTA